MRSRFLAAGFALSTLLALPVEAQQAGTLEFGLFVRKNWYGDSYNLVDRAGGGARLGFFLINNLEVEGDVTYSPTEFDTASARFAQDVRVLGLRGRLNYHVPLAQHISMILGGGVTYNKYDDAVSGNEFGPSGLVGLRLGLGGPVHIRLDGTFDYFGSPNEELSGEDKDYHYGFQAGLSWFPGQRGVATTTADADNDGVGNAMDQCPDTPAGTRVNSSGCPEVQMDAAPADTAAADTVATPAVDTAAQRLQAEQDSIARVRAADSARMQAARDSINQMRAADSARMAALEDSLRMARTEAQRASLRDSIAAARIRDSLRILVTTEDSRLVLQGVNFATNTSTLTQSSRFILDEVANSLNANPNVRVEVAGHTDNTGPRALNERLSRQRAEAVVTYLADKGVDRSRMESKGYAWDEPVAPNTTREGRALNRRTELRRID